jgi:hypothetical protein
MKILALMLMKLALTQAPVSQANPVNTEWIGECYTLFSCQGVSVGILNDDQCRNFGGHSMKVGAVCMPL